MSPALLCPSRPWVLTLDPQPEQLPCPSWGGYRVLTPPFSQSPLFLHKSCQLPLRFANQTPSLPFFLAHLSAAGPWAHASPQRSATPALPLIMLPASLCSGCSLGLNTLPHFSDGLLLAVPSESAQHHLFPEHSPLPQGGVGSPFSLSLRPLHLLEAALPTLWEFLALLSLPLTRFEHLEGRNEVICLCFHCT